MKTLVLANPNAGGLDDVERLAEAIAGMPGVELLLTESPEEIERLAAEAPGRGFERVVAAGGDGTLNQVVNALAPDFPSCGLGLLPLGTGNDFARTVGIPAEVAGSLAVLAGGRTCRLDLVRVSGEGRERYLINTSAGGFSHRLGEAMSPEIKRAWGPLAYLRSAAGAAPELEPFRVRLNVDGEELRLAAYTVVVANGRYVASGIPVAPEARVDDGLADLVVIAAMPWREVAMLTPKALLGRHLDDERVTFRQARRIEVDAEPAMTFNVDGEPFAATPLVFEVLPGAVEMVVGEPTGADPPG